MRELIRAPEFSSKSSAAAIKGYLGSRLCFCSITPHLRKQARILSPIDRATAQKLSQRTFTAAQDCTAGRPLAERAVRLHRPALWASLFPTTLPDDGSVFLEKQFILKNRYMHTISCVGGHHELQAPAPRCLGRCRNVFRCSFGGAESLARRCAGHTGKLCHKSGSDSPGSAQHQGFAREIRNG